MRHQVSAIEEDTGNLTFAQTPNHLLISPTTATHKINAWADPMYLIIRSEPEHVWKGVGTALEGYRSNLGVPGHGL